MSTKDKRIDVYISKSAVFAQPILIHLRQLIHQACPEVEETIKWGFPHFDYRGIMCSMAAFKQHCAFSFWKGSLMKDPDEVFDASDTSSMGHLGRLLSLADLPSDGLLVKYIKEAAKLNEKGINKPVKISAKKELVIPDTFLKLLAKNKQAQNNFNSFSYSEKKEYIEWITEAKTESTTSKRLKTTLEWLAEGKTKNWKYK